MSSQLLVFALLLGLVLSCGKKAHETKHSSSDDLTYSEAEVNFYLSSEIRRCVENGDVVQLKRIFEKRRNLKLNEIGHDGETLLTKSISLGHVQMARILINAGASIHVSNINNETPLIIAVNKNLSVLAQDLVKLGVDPNKKDIFGDTALILAIKSKNEALGIFLIENGASVLTNDRYNRSPYNLSKQYELENLAEAIKLILEEQFGEPSEEEFKDQILRSEFRHIARTINRFNHLVVQYEEVNPLALLSYRSKEDEMMEAAKLFIRWGAKVDGPAGVSINPPLIEAIINLKINYAQFLIEQKANLNKLSVENFPPLYYAIELNEPELVKKLYSNGAKKRLNDFDACELVKKLSHEFKTSHDKQNNKQIKKILSCTLFGWP